MKKEGKTKKVFIVKGDVVQFVLSPTATFTKGNFFEGTVVAIVPKEFSVRIRPTKNALKKVAPFTDRMGLITVGFRCARIKSMKAHWEQVRANREAEKLEKERRFQERLAKLVTPSKKKSKPKKEKKKHKWHWTPT
jgi:hypothetical protein